MVSRKVLLVKRKEARSPPYSMPESKHRTPSTLLSTTTSQGSLSLTQAREAQSDSPVCHLLLLPRELLLIVLFYCDVVSVCKLAMSSQFASHIIAMSGFYKEFPERSSFKIVRLLGTHLQDNWFASAYGLGISDRPRMMKYPLVVEHNLREMTRALSDELQKECVKLKLRFDVLFLTRLQRGYPNCWKNCCSLARQTLYVELLYIRMQALKKNTLFPRAAMTVPHAVYTVLWPTETSPKRALISLILGVFHNRSLDSGSCHLRRSLFPLSSSLRRSYYHMNFSARRHRFTDLIMRPDLAPLTVRLPNGLKCETGWGMPMFPPPLLAPIGSVAIIDIETSDEEDEGILCY